MATTASSYRASIRSAIRGLWSGSLTEAGFTGAMKSAISRAANKAFAEGAGRCGVKPADYTAKDRAIIALFVSEQSGYISGLAEAIAAADKKARGLLNPLLGRAELWVNQIGPLADRAQASICGDDPPKEFVMGATEKHCKSCNGLKGRVYRLSVWVANNAVPPTSRTHCGGWRCLCRLEDTTKPITRGKFPIGLLK